MGSSTTAPLAIEFTVDSSHPYAVYEDPVTQNNKGNVVGGVIVGVHADGGCDERGHGDGGHVDRKDDKYKRYVDTK